MFLPNFPRLCVPVYPSVLHVCVCVLLPLCVCVGNVRPSIVHPSKHPAYAYKSNLVRGSLPLPLSQCQEKKYKKNLIIFYVFFSFSFSLSLSVSCYSYRWMTTRPNEKLTWNQKNAEQKVEKAKHGRNREKAMAKQSETKQEMSLRNEKWNKWDTTTTTCTTAREIMWYTSHKKQRQAVQKDHKDTATHGKGD